MITPNVIGDPLVFHPVPSDQIHILTLVYDQMPAKPIKVSQVSAVPPVLVLSK